MNINDKNYTLRAFVKARSVFRLAYALLETYADPEGGACLVPFQPYLLENLFDYIWNHLSMTGAGNQCLYVICVLRQLC